MNYLHEILTRADKELIKRIYIAQKESPSNGDFVNLMKSDFEYISYPISDEFISQMGQIKYKNLIHDKLHKVPFHEFSALQAQHSKVSDIPYIDLSLQQYLKYPEFSKEDCNLLMALRSHSITGHRRTWRLFR